MTSSTNPYLTAKAAARKKTDPPVALVCAIFAAATASSTVKMFSQGKALAGVMGILIFAALATPVFASFAAHTAEPARTASRGRCFR
ncbi:MAG: hypothetical protein ACLUE8_00560 [Lachnospiraceae bacterium]